jgi:hypothetical protein
LKSFFYLLLLWLLIMINFQFPLDTNLFLGSESSCMLDSGWNFLFFFSYSLNKFLSIFFKKSQLRYWETFHDVSGLLFYVFSICYDSCRHTNDWYQITYTLIYPVVVFSTRP